jgi:predicted RNase H-like nuclease (RuvC/YqgF family)
MNKEETNKLMTILEYRREISKLKAEIKRKDKLIQRLENKIKRLER